MSSQLETALESGLAEELPHWQEVYRDLHAHPELGFAEHRTAAAVARELQAAGGWEVTGGVGGTGVVGVLRNGDGPVILMRADMDALPVQEDTGLPYASVESGRMHACGHDVHVTCLLGACRQLAAHPGAWRGTVVAVFQPAEEVGGGAAAMLDDGFVDRFPTPEVCLGQHVNPIPVGMVMTRPGPVMAAADSLRVTLYGAGGHASTPQLAVHPGVLAASVILRLQTFSAQQAPLSPASVLTVGAVHAGTAPNIIPNEAEVLLSLRTFGEQDRTEALAAVDRIVRAEAQASNAPKVPDIERINGFPLTVNTEAATEQVIGALESAGTSVHRMGMPLAASEDFGAFGTRIGCPSVFWHFGGTDPTSLSEQDLASLGTEKLPAALASNHSPKFAPAPEPTVSSGIRSLLAVSDRWVGEGRRGAET